MYKNLVIKCFSLNNFLWSDIHTLLHTIAVNTCWRSFKYKILHNVLYLNDHLNMFRFLFVSFTCKTEKNTLSLRFHYCTYIQNIAINLGISLQIVCFSQLTTQTAIFVFHNINNYTFLIENPMLLLFKVYINIYTYIYIFIYLSIYIYLSITYIYIYIYIYI